MQVKTLGWQKAVLRDSSSPGALSFYYSILAALQCAAVVFLEYHEGK